MSGANQGVASSSGNIDDEEPPPPTSTAEIMLEAEQNRRDQTRLLERIEQNTSRQHHSVVTIQDFILLNPPVFRCPSEPLDADDWLHSLERKLETAHVAPGDRVLFAAYFLEGAALQWWENFIAMQPVGHVVTWQEFNDDFRGYHIPYQLMERKREEFCNLTQGKMSVQEYRNDFTRLARYAQEEVSTDAKKQARFRKGLSPVLRHDLNLHEFANFRDLVNKAFKAEYGNELYEESRKRDREFAQSSGPVSRKRCVWISFKDVRHAVSASKPSTTIYRPPQPKLPPWIVVGQSSAQVPFIPRGVCFQCGQTCHNVRECPYNHVATTSKPKQAICRGKPPTKTPNVKPPAYEYGYVNHVSIGRTHKSTDVVLGTLPINSTLASF